MSNQSDSGVDSLELFTDPVCNIFGLFCFLIILIALLTTVKSGGEAAGQSSSKVNKTAEQLQSVVAELEARQIAAVDPRKEEKLQTLASLQAAIERLQSVQTEADRREDAAVDELKIGKEPQRALGDMVPKLEVEVARLKQAIEEAKARTQLSTSLPREHSVAHAEVVSFILKGGSLYLVNAIPDWWSSSRNASMCEALQKWEPACINVQKSKVDCDPSGTTGIQTVVLQDSGGVPLRNIAWKDDPKWVSWWNVMSAQPNLVVYFMVDPDSFSDLATIRNFLVANSKEYNLDVGETPLTISWRYGTPNAQ